MFDNFITDIVFGSEGVYPVIYITVFGNEYNLLSFLQNEIVTAEIGFLKGFMMACITFSTILNVMKNFPDILDGNYHFADGILWKQEESGAYMEVE